MGTSNEASLPTLAYVYHPLSFSPFSVTAAAEGVCRMVWVIDSSQPEMATMRRLLRKFGPVIDAADRTVEEVAADVQEHAPDGVLSMHDADLVWTAKLADALGLEFHSLDSAIKLTDKHAQRKALAAAGLTVPASKVIPADADAASVTELGTGFPYPAVLKPRSGQASRDTLPIASQEELERTVERFRSRTDVPAEEYVLEQFVPDPSEPLGGIGFAPFVSVESIVEAGRVEHAAISARTPFLWPFRETGYCTPTALSPELQDEVMDVAGQAAHALGITQACLHTEIKLTDEGPVVIEVNGRPGGGMSEMLERASGFSILRTALNLAVGNPVGLERPVPCSRIGYFLYVFPYTDVEWIDSVEGLAELGKVEGVDEVVLVTGAGGHIDIFAGSEAHVFHFAGTTQNHDELRSLIAAIPTIVAIEGHNEDDSDG